MSQAIAVETSTRSKKPAPLSYKTVDADAHVNPPPDFWHHYLPKHLQELAPRIESGDDADYVVFEGRRKKLNIINAQAGRKGKDFKMEGRQSDTRSGGWEPEARLADMDADGIDAQIMFGGGPLGTKNMDLYIESFRAYNRWLADFCAHDPRRFCGVAYLPLREVDETITMMKEAANLGFTAVNIPAFPQNMMETTTAGPTGASSALAAQAAALTGNPWGEKQYYQPEYDRLWAAAVDLNLTLTFHLGGRIVRFENKQAFLSDMVMSKFAMCEPIAILLFSGVFMRHPKLRIATIESGGGWLAFATDYMDKTWEKQRYWIDSPLQEPPSFYMDQNVYASFIHDRVAIETRNLPGARNIMWSSDYPHSETTFPESHKMIARIFAGVPESEKHMIICERARKLFRVGE